MKQLITVCLFTFLTFTAFSQSFIDISYESSYSTQTFYSLEDDEKTQVGNTEWDIALSALGLQDAGIHLNEATGFSQSALNLYAAPTNDFDTPIDQFDTDQPIYNDDLSWEFGAFNAARSIDDPFDYGWGVYNPTTGSVEGNSVFIIQLRDGSYRKIQIVSLVETIYTIKHAKLDGTDIKELSVDKSDYSDTQLILISLNNNTVIDPINTSWDLLFTRYIAPLDDGTGNFLDYNLTGVLSAPGVEVAVASGVDPFTADPIDYANQYESNINQIGYDWKAFDLYESSWVVYSDLAFFVKTDEGQIWKIVFIDFEGSFSGVTVFEKSLVGNVSAVKDPVSVFESLNVFPNPAQTQASLIYEIKEASEVKISMFNTQGQALWSDQIFANSGLNAYEFQTSQVAAGTYIMQITNGQEVQQQILVVQ